MEVPGHCQAGFFGSTWNWLASSGRAQHPEPEELVCGVGAKLWGWTGVWGSGVWSPPSSELGNRLGTERGADWES